MTPEPATKANRQTWEAWLAPDLLETGSFDLFTRDELLARLQRRGVDVSANELRYWEYEGILPRAVRLWDPEAKARRAYYPLWMMAPIAILRELRREFPLRDIVPYLQDAAKTAALEIHHFFPTGQLSADPDKERQMDHLVLSSALQRIFVLSIEPALQRYVQLLDRIEGEETEEAIFVLTNTSGQERRRGGFLVWDEHGIPRALLTDPVNTSVAE